MNSRKGFIEWVGSINHWLHSEFNAVLPQLLLEHPSYLRVLVFVYNQVTTGPDVLGAVLAIVAAIAPGKVIPALNPTTRHRQVPGRLRPGVEVLVESQVARGVDAVNLPVPLYYLVSVSVLVRVYPVATVPN